MKIGLLQYDVNDSPQHNTATVLNYLRTCDDSYNLICLPELFHTSFEALPRQAISWDHPCIEPLIGWSAENPEIPLLGSAALSKSGRISNMFFGIKKGEVHEIYEKIHLFSPMNEEKSITAGSSLTLMIQEAGGKTWRIGCAVCYDLRFPEIFRLFALNGCDLVVLPAQWPDRRINIWRCLLQARAAENQFFLAGANRVGSASTERFGGCSAVFNPSGEEIAALQDQPGLLTCILDKEDTARARRFNDILADRRPDVYSLESKQSLKIVYLT